MQNRLYHKQDKTLQFVLIRAYKPAPKVSAEIPLGLLYIIAAVRQAFPKRFSFHIIDMPLHGLSVDQAVAGAKACRADIVGISAFTFENEIVKEMVKKTRSQIPDALVLIGGPYASASTELALRENPEADAIVIGECEHSLPELLHRQFHNAPVRDLPGIAYYEHAEPIIQRNPGFIENLDSLPMPAWDQLDIDSYNNSPLRPTNHFRRQKRVVPVFTSRGCPYRCAYCHKIFGKRLRVRSAENFFNELMDLYDTHKVREIHVLDDAFNLDKERMRKICRFIIDQRLELSIGFASGLRGDQLEESDVDLLKQAGAYFIRYAVETASPRLQKKIHKYVQLDKLKRITDYTVKKGIFTQGLFMLGFPGETEEELHMTVNYALASSFHTMSAFQVVPFPGTDLYDMAREVKPDYTYSPDYLFFSGKSFYQEATGIDLNPIQRKLYLRFYANPRRLFRIVWDIPEKNGLLRGGISILNNTIFRKLWVTRSFSRRDPLEAR